MQFRYERELVCDKTGNREFVREKAEDDKNHAGEERNGHDNRIAQGNFCLVQRKRERDEKAEEHGQESLDAGEQYCRNRLACLVELFAEGERLYRIAAKTGREQVVEKITHGRVGVVRLERNFRTLYRKPLPAVRLDDHDESRCDKHRDNPRCHANVPVLDDLCEWNLVENIGEAANAYKKLDNSLDKKLLACLIGCHCSKNSILATEKIIFD